MKASKTFRAGFRSPWQDTDRLSVAAYCRRAWGLAMSEQAVTEALWALFDFEQLRGPAVVALTTASDHRGYISARVRTDSGSGMSAELTSNRQAGPDLVITR